MKGVAITSILAVLLFGSCSTILANPPIAPPTQYEQFCENQKVSGKGIIDVSTSMVDKNIALEYYSTIAGDGDLELDSEHAYSQNPEKLKRNVSTVNGGNKSGLNLYEATKMTYSGAKPLVGGKYLNSKSFYGGIGASLQETFSVFSLEKDETSFFASTTPYRPKKNVSPDELIKMLKSAGRNTTEVESLMTSNDGVYIPSHLVGIETKNVFSGTWGTDAKWHKIFSKDIKAHESFTGAFETEKTLKFHENPVPEKISIPCEGIDC